MKTEIIVDLKDALSDSLSERYEYLYVKMIEASNELGLPCLFANRTICEVFMAATSGIAWRALPTEPGVHVMGTVNNRWLLHYDTNMPEDELLIHNNHNSITLKIRS